MSAGDREVNIALRHRTPITLMAEFWQRVDILKDLSNHLTATVETAFQPSMPPLLARAIENAGPALAKALRQVADVSNAFLERVGNSSLDRDPGRLWQDEIAHTTADLTELGLSESELRVVRQLIDLFTSRSLVSHGDVALAALVPSTTAALESFVAGWMTQFYITHPEALDTAQDVTFSFRQIRAATGSMG